MSYKTILLHVNSSKHVDQCIHVAAKIAELEKAHLIGVATIGLARLTYETMVSNTNDLSAMSYVESLREGGAEALSRFETVAQNIGVKSFEKRLVNDEASAGLSLQARYADLVVLGQPDPDERPMNVMSAFPDHVIMNCRTPGLIVPYARQRGTVAESVLIAWDGSEEATQAVHNAVPLLQHAMIVRVAIFDSPSQPEARGDQCRKDITLYLARHNIQVEVIQRKAVFDTGKELLSLARELDSDMLVMGCYGHSRFREMLLGGTTRTVLESTTIPLLMSH